MLHFFIFLTGHKKILKKWWIYPLLYIPSLVTWLGFTFVPTLNPHQYNLIHTLLGWVNVAKNTGWDWFYTVYYLAFSLISLTLVFVWGKRTDDVRFKKQARNIVLSFLITVTVGSLTDILGNSIFAARLPQMAPLYMALPIIVIFYTMRKYGLLGSKVETETFITEKIRRRLSTTFFIAAVAGALWNIFTQYFSNTDHEDLIDIMLYSLVFLAFGLSFLIINRLKINDKKKDFIYTVLLSILIPVMTFKYIEYGGITIWAASFICLIVVLLMNRRYMIGLIVVSFLFTQAFLWLTNPVIPAEINNVAYLSRIGIFLIAAWLALYVNRVFMAKNNENKLQLRIQKFISDISTEFISVGESNYSEKINGALRKTGQFFGFDHTYLFIFNPSHNQLSLLYQWHASESGIRATTDTSLNEIPFIIEQILANKSVVISDKDTLGEDQLAGLNMLLNHQPQSFIAVPVVTMDSVQGFFAAAFTSTRNVWNDNHINTIKIISNILADADAKVRQEQEINRMAFYDFLTGLPNKLLFHDRVSQAIELAKRTGNALAVMFFDLDAFKAVNDTMGHQGGDSMLLRISEALLHVVRKTDTVSRFGGDEFLILINHMSAVKDTLFVANKIMGIFQKPFSINEQDYYITASAGIAVYPEDGEDAETLIKNADIAMYKAKEKGKNRYELCSPDMKEEALIKMQLTNSLYRALDKNELFLVYQPQIDLTTNTIIGVEALLRWSHPEMGLIPPVQFIPLAEQTGLIGPIGEWVIRTACRQNKAWQDTGYHPIRMAVNISVIQFRNPNLVSQIKGILADTGLDPKYFELELTESVANNESSYTIDVFNHLKALGVSISIDDFGTEYSSLNRLKMLPVDRIKLDIQFVRDICGNKKDKAIAGIIINLAQSLDLKIIAEGVENEQQLKYLTRRKCDEVQGFYFYKPLLAEDMESLLKES